MLPVHQIRPGIFNKPQETEPPFTITYKPGQYGEPITVFLKSKQSNKFIGFMLEARKRGMENDGPPVGKFIVLEPTQTRLQSCNRLPNNAVSQRTNSQKSLFAVNWTAQGEDLNYTLRYLHILTDLEKSKSGLP
ncbi:hypothetical protein PBY51_024829 [Eleginops maclovinus]|uniref:Reelin domain-containing protein n=1 Tax=Eleginops maclovinus TaxID=56733 RepID=A0AAN8AWD8_ELEMC|nr:hypothetical protein PBY51_024829 [Eleginops maclovinus]